MNNDITLFSELIDRIYHALERPSFQSQFLGVLFSFIVAWIFNRTIRQWWDQKFAQLEETPKEKQSKRRQKIVYYTSTIINYFLLSVLALILVYFLYFFFGQLRWRSGLISVVIETCWFFLLYRLFLLSCYFILPDDSVDRYRYLYFAPLFLLFIIRSFIDILFDLESFFQIEVSKFFGYSLSVGSILVFTVGIYFLIMGVYLIEEVFLSVTSKLTKEEKKIGTLKATSIIVRYSLIGLGIVLFCGYVGFSSNALAAISGGLSVGIGFSLKEILSNFLSGLSLLFEGSIRPGDVVEVDGEIATVETVSIRATKVKTLDHIEKIIPNQFFFSNTVTTYTGTDSIVRILIPVGVSYNSVPEDVIRILLSVAKKNNYIRPYPPPFVHLVGYGDSSVDFRLGVFIDTPLVQLTIKSDLYREIWKALKENNIEIPFPQRDLHIRSDFRIRDEEIS